MATEITVANFYVFTLSIKMSIILNISFINCNLLFMLNYNFKLSLFHHYWSFQSGKENFGESFSKLEFFFSSPRNRADLDLKSFNIN